MKAFIAISVRSLAIAALWAMTSSPARAGRFSFEMGCETLSVAPPRILLKFQILDKRNYGELCEIRLEPTADYGVPLNPVLECVTPVWLACSIDSSGGASMVAASCVEYWESDSLGIVVERPIGQYYANLIQSGGHVRTTDLLQFNCEAGTAVVPSTWGRVKAIYR